MMVMFVEHVFPHIHIASVLRIPIDAPKKTLLVQLVL